MTTLLNCTIEFVIDSSEINHNGMAVNISFAPTDDVDWIGWDSYINMLSANNEAKTTEITRNLVVYESANVIYKIEILLLIFHSSNGFCDIFLCLVQRMKQKQRNLLGI